MEKMITIAKNSNDKEFIKYAYERGLRHFRLNFAYLDDAIKATENLSVYSDIVTYYDFPGGKYRIQLGDKGSAINVINNSEMKISLYEGYSFPYISSFNAADKIEVGERVSFSDNRLLATIIEKDDTSITIRFYNDTYPLKDNAGCSFQGVNAPVPHFTKEYYYSIKSTLVSLPKPNWIILSFVETLDDIIEVAKDLKQQGIKVMAKIESPRGVDNLYSIASAVDGVMIGRGDLKNIAGDSDYDEVYKKSLAALRALPNKCFKGVGTFILNDLSLVGTISKADYEDIKEIIELGQPDYIMVSKEVVNSVCPYKVIDYLSEMR